MTIILMLKQALSILILVFAYVFAMTIVPPLIIWVITKKDPILYLFDLGINMMDIEEEEN